MAQIREIKKRMVAVGNIQRITKTMQMIATAKFNSAVQRAQATKPYTQGVQKLVAQVAAAAGDVDHPLVNGPDKPAGSELILVISTDRGFCGAYNNNVLRAAGRHLRELAEQGLAYSIETSGKKATAYFKFQKMKVDHAHTFGDKPRYDAVEALADRFIEAFAAGRYDAVRVVYMKYISNARQVPEMLTLLPLKPEAAAAAGAEAGSEGGAALYEFSPSSGELLSDLLPRAVRTMLFQAFNDAVVSEQIMKMIAMKAATENAKDLGRSLRRQFNRARQSQITTELMEVIGGAAALG